MPVIINGFELTDAMVEAELPFHQETANPVQMATQELVFRRLLLDKADELEIEGSTDQERIDAVLSQEIHIPSADTETCKRYFEQNSSFFTTGAIAEASHILFQVTPNLDLNSLRAKAQEVLQLVKDAPDQFAELAKTFSNCPSGAVGGQLGQLSKGQTVPEFEAALFTMKPGSISDKLIETRFGLHIIQLHRRDDGKPIPFEQVETKIHDYLEQQSYARGLHQYLQRLVAAADISGIELQGAEAGSPLVQ